jgi:hypothetical protein
LTLADEDEFVKKMEELVSMIEASDKIDSNEKMNKIKELHRANKPVFEKLSPQRNVKLSYFVGDAITKLKRGD